VPFGLPLVQILFTVKHAKNVKQFLDVLYDLYV